MSLPSAAVSSVRTTSLSVGRGARAKQTTRSSTFFITLNTNYAPTTDEEAERMGSDLENAIEQLTQDDEIMRKMIIFRNGAPREFSKIKSINVQFAAEIGSVRGMLHAHVLVEIVHEVSGPGIHLSIPTWKRGIRKYATNPRIGKIPFVNVKASAGRHALINYIAKGNEKQSRVLSQ